MTDTTPVIDWRFVLCDNRYIGGPFKYSSEPIAILDGIAADMAMEFKLNRSCMATFSVPSEYTSVNKIWGPDGLPYLSVGKRALKCYRQVGGPGNPWKLKFAGRVWSLGDDGDTDSVRTSVSCYDPLKICEKRVIRQAKNYKDPTDSDAVNTTLGGTFWPDPVIWHDTAADTTIQTPLKSWEDGSTMGKIILDCLDRTRRFGGTDGGPANAGDVTLAPLHIQGKYNSFYDKTTHAYPYQSDQAMIMDAIVQITNTGLCDLDISFLDNHDAIFIQIICRDRVGTDKDITLSYASAPNTAMEYHRTQALDDMANYIGVMPKTQTGPLISKTDATSKQDYLVMEAVESLTDVTHRDVVKKLASMELHMRKDPRDLVTVVPTPENSPAPWGNNSAQDDGYYLGDTINVEAADIPYPVTRETVVGRQRVYGFKLTIDNDFGEWVSQLLVSNSDVTGV
jgi:hypothetical protein